MSSYYFTFGVGQPLDGFYQKIIAGSFPEAEKKMFEEWGKTWAMGYTETQFVELHGTQKYKPLKTLCCHSDMTVGEMLGWTRRFNQILGASQRLKDTRLANLMTDMEQAYSIPFLNDEEFNEKNPHVIQMYKTVSDARSFEEASI